MQSHISSFMFSSNFNFGTHNLFIYQNPDEGSPFPPSAGNFRVLEGTDFLLLNGGNFLLL